MASGPIADVDRGVVATLAKIPVDHHVEARPRHGGPLLEALEIAVIRCDRGPGPPHVSGSCLQLSTGLRMTGPTLQSEDWISPLRWVHHQDRAWALVLERPAPRR